MSAEIHQKWIELQLNQFDLAKWSLSAQGAEALRRTRDIIIQFPEAFDMDLWECGTTACIGGHLCRLMDLNGDVDQDFKLAKFFGMDLKSMSFFFEKDHPLWWLFFSYQSEDTTVEGATRRINGFLNYFGHPEVGPEFEEVEDECVNV